jgi:hypothetical protein
MIGGIGTLFPPSKNRGQIDVRVALAADWDFDPAGIRLGTVAIPALPGLRTDDGSLR